MKRVILAAKAKEQESF